MSRMKRTCNRTSNRRFQPAMNHLPRHEGDAVPTAGPSSTSTWTGTSRSEVLYLFELEANCRCMMSVRMARMPPHYSPCACHAIVYGVPKHATFHEDLIRYDQDYSTFLLLAPVLMFVAYPCALSPIQSSCAHPAKAAHSRHT